MRGCGRPLAHDAAGLRCGAGHAFDLAREGYWNLLQPQDRRSTAAGDAAAVVEARRRWAERGRFDPLLDALVEWVQALGLPAGAVVVDCGCGEGAVLARLAAVLDLRACGIDISVPAIRRACRRLPGATWVVANADRRLPLGDASVHLLLSVFGRRNGPEFHRVLQPGGRLLAIVPGEDDLIELRAAILGRPLRLERAGRARTALAPWLEPLEQRQVRVRARLDREGIEEALALTYRGARQSQRARTERLEALDVTLSSDLLLFRPA